MLYHTEGEDLILRDAVKPSGVDVVLFRDQVFSASLALYDLSSATPDTAVYSAVLGFTAEPSSLDYTQCMFSTLQVDDSYPRGYTFQAQILNADYAIEAFKRYRAVATLTGGHIGGVWPYKSSYGTIIREWDITGRSTQGL